MADLNKVMLIGRLTRDPQLRHTPSQMPVCEFGFAVGHKYKTASGEQREETMFIDCTLFGKGGEVFSQYMQKGRQAYIEGRLKLDQWEDKNGGGKRSKHVFIVENFQFLGDKGGSGGGAPQAQGDDGGYAGQNSYDRSAPPARPPQSRPPAQQRPAPQQPSPEAPYGEEQAFNDDDIPF